MPNGEVYMTLLRWAKVFTNDIQYFLSNNFFTTYGGSSNDNEFLS